MKFFIFSIFIALLGCSSTQDKTLKHDAPKDLSKDSFKKEKSFKSSEVPDFYTGNAKAMSPALQDETMDRFSSEELSQFSDETDPLLSISLGCQEKKFDEAFKKASQVFNRYQKVALYWNIVANCHLNQGSYRKALLFYNKAVEIQPNYVPALNNIGVMYTRQGQYQKALVAFEKAYNTSKFSKTPRYNLAKLYLSYGLVDLALPILQGLLSTSPNDVDLLNSVASCYFLRSEYQTALGTYQRIPKDLWENAEIGLNVAFALKRMNRHEDAKKVFLAVNSPSSSELKRYYASVGKILGENE